MDTLQGSMDQVANVVFQQTQQKELKSASKNQDDRGRTSLTDIITEVSFPGDR